MGGDHEGIHCIPTILQLHCSFLTPVLFWNYLTPRPTTFRKYTSTLSNERIITGDIRLKIKIIGRIGCD